MHLMFRSWFLKDVVNCPAQLDTKEFKMTGPLICQIISRTDVPGAQTHNSDHGTMVKSRAHTGLEQKLGHKRTSSRRNWVQMKLEDAKTDLETLRDSR